MMNPLCRRLALAAALVVGGCAMGPTRDDPFEPFNRAMYAVHEPIDTHVVRPFIEGYTKVVPSPSGRRRLLSKPNVRSVAG